MLFAWTALGAAFGPVLFARLAGWRPHPNAVFLAMMTGFFVSVAFNQYLYAGPSNLYERIGPWICPLLLLYVWRLETPRSNMMADPQNLETDVLIVGAGPVGLLAANALVEKSIDIYICDKLNAPVEELRASTFHPPTLDLLEPLGLTSAVLENGLKSPEWQIRFHETGDRVVFDLSVLKADTNHPYRVQCEQAHLAAAARAKLGRACIEVNYGCQVEDIVDKGAFVETTLMMVGYALG